MLKQDTECHVLNVASVEGLWTRVTGASYQVSKHGVVALSEALKLEMALTETKIGVSVLCPGAVITGITNPWRNRPEALQNPPGGAPETTPEMAERIATVKKVFEEGMPPLGVADHVFPAVRQDRFFILTHPELNGVIKKRLDRVLSGGVPTREYTIPNLPDYAALSPSKTTGDEESKGQHRFWGNAVRSRH